MYSILSSSKHRFQRKRESTQLQLIDTWEMDNQKLIEYYKPTWRESLWNKNVWYLQTKSGHTTTDLYERSQHQGTMLPQKIK